MARQKTGGRRPGSPNRTTLVIRERIEREADPIGFMIDVMRGVEVRSPVTGEDTTPDLDQRIDAAKWLGNKIAPNLKALEVEGEVGITGGEALAMLIERLDGETVGLPSEAEREAARSMVETE